MKAATFIATLVLVFASAQAKTTAPSDESLNELFRLMQLEKLNDQTLAQMSAVTESTLYEPSTANGGPITAQQQAVATKLKQKIREATGWQQMRDIYIQVYRESFTQDEVDGLIAFYKTPTGKALVEKGPAVFSRTVSLLQQRLQSVMEKLQKEIEGDLRESK